MARKSAAGDPVSRKEAPRKNGSRKVIITCAVTGSVHTPTMTPYLPITPDQIAKESVAAAEAGASVIHLHARDPKDGRPTRILTYSCSSCPASSRAAMR